MPTNRFMGRLLVILQMIKFEHTVFALPFAFLGAFLAARGFPGWEKTGWILLAMTAARSAAMGFNRLVDRDLDARNPRTADRALPRHLLTPQFVALFVAFSAVLFLLSAWVLNPLAFALSPLALVIVLGYSLTKRFTHLSHLFLGLALGIAPVGGWIAVTGTLDWYPLLLATAVLFWVGGFDIIYSCLDVDFDRKEGLFSIPRWLGIRRALLISAIFHALMVGQLSWAFAVFDLTLLSWLGLALVTIALIYEHTLVTPHDLSRVNAAFFSINGVISVLLFLFVGFDLCLLV